LPGAQQKLGCAPALRPLISSIFIIYNLFSSYPFVILFLSFIFSLFLHFLLSFYLFAVFYFLLIIKGAMLVRVVITWVW